MPSRVAHPQSVRRLVAQTLRQPAPLTPALAGVTAAGQPYAHRSELPAARPMPLAPSYATSRTLARPVSATLDIDQSVTRVLACLREPLRRVDGDRALGVGRAVEQLQSILRIDDASVGPTVLLYGHAGTGKTRLALELACAQDRPLFVVHQRDLASREYGDGERFVRALFEQARQRPRAMVLFEDISDWMRRRGDGMETERQMQTALLQELSEPRGVAIMCTATAPWDIHPAALRRLRHLVGVPLPTETERILHFTRARTRDGAGLTQADCIELARSTDGWAPRDIYTLVADEGPLISLQTLLRQTNLPSEDLVRMFAAFEAEVAPSRRSSRASAGPPQATPIGAFWSRAIVAAPGPAPMWAFEDLQITDAVAFWTELVPVERPTAALLDVRLWHLPSFEVRVLTEFLQALCATAEFRHHGCHLGLAERLIDLLAAMQVHETLRQRCLERMHQGLSSCGDGVILTMSDMELLLRIHLACSGENPEAELRILACRMAKLEVVRRHAGVLIDTMRQAGINVDDVEVFLAFETGLIDRLNLPVSTRRMLYRAHVPLAQLEAAACEAEQIDASPTLQERFLTTWDPWRRFLRQRDSRAHRWECVLEEPTIAPTVAATLRCPITQKDFAELTNAVFIHRGVSITVFEYAEFMVWWVDEGTTPDSQTPIELSALRRILEPTRQE